MGMYLSYNQSSAVIVENLLHFGKYGDMSVIYGSPDNRSQNHGFILVKCGKNLIKGYTIYRSWLHDGQLKNPQFEITKSGGIHGGGKVKWLKDGKADFRRSTVDGSIDWAFRSFMSLGIIQHMEVEYIYKAELWNFNGTRTASIRSKDFSFGFNGVMISQVPKKCKTLIKDALETRRLTKNANARANYANTITVKKVNEALATEDFSKLVPNDIFKLRNVATRTILIEHFGQDKILETLKPDVVHEDIIDSRKYELLRFEIPDTSMGHIEFRTATYLKMINPSTGEHCIEGVPNNANGNRWSMAVDMNTVQQALSWRDGDTGQYIVPQALT